MDLGDSLEETQRFLQNRKRLPLDQGDGRERETETCKTRKIHVGRKDGCVHSMVTRVKLMANGQSSAKLSNHGQVKQPRWACILTYNVVLFLIILEVSARKWEIPILNKCLFPHPSISTSKSAAGPLHCPLWV